MNDNNIPCSDFNLKFNLLKIFRENQYCDQNMYLIRIIEQFFNKKIKQLSIKNDEKLLTLIFDRLLFNVVYDNRGGNRLQNGSWNGAFNLIYLNVIINQGSTRGGGIAKIPPPEIENFQNTPPP